MGMRSAAAAVAAVATESSNGHQHKQQQQQQQGNQQLQSHQSSSSAEEIALKKHTDCVYFLASPLTCKKGNECEFRHSEAARINPRDCWFWSCGTCLNRDCSFRHPPPAPTPVAPVVAPSPAAANSKGRTPCFYYHQGYCARGDHCSFMHGAPSHQHHSAHNPSLQPVSAPPVPEKPAEKEAVVQQPKPEMKPVVARPQSAPKATKQPEVQLQTAPESKPSRPNKVPEVTRPAAEELKSRRNGVVTESEVVRSGDSNAEAEDDSGTDAGRGDSGGRDWEESSPGFDVLVDDGPEEGDYHGEGGDYHGNVDEDMEGYEGYEPRETFDQRPAFDQYEPQARYNSGVYEFERSNDGFDHIDYDRPRLEARPSSDLFRPGPYNNGVRTEHLTIRDRLNFNTGVERRPYLENGDLRNLLEKRRRADTLDRYRGDVVNRDVYDGYRGQNQHHLDDYERLQGRQPQYVQQHHGRQNGPRSSRSRERSYVGEGGGGNRRYDYLPDGEYVPQPRSRSQSRSYSERRTSSRDVSVPAQPRQGGYHRKGDVRDNDGGGDFAPPKSLAQIRAEKRKWGRDEQGEEEEEPSVKRRDVGRYGENNFSAPKPLSEILKEKRHHHESDHDGEPENQLQHRQRPHAFTNGFTVKDQLLHLVDAGDNGNNNVNGTTGDDELSDEEDDDFAKKLGGYFS